MTGIPAYAPGSPAHAPGSIDGRGGQGVSVHELPEVSRLDQAVFSEGACFSMGEEEARQFRLDVIRQAVVSHLQECELYARLASHAGFVADHLQNESDLIRVPLIPTGVFKRAPIRSSLGGPVLRTFLSSGTRGRQSVVERDEVSLQRLLGSVKAGLQMLGGDEQAFDEADVLNLGPTRQEAGNVWFSYVMSLVELVAETRHYVRGGHLDISRLIADFGHSVHHAERTFIVGPPTFVAQVAHRILAEGLEIRDRDITVITGGGWKSPTNEEPLDRAEFARQVSAAFGLQNATAIRDAFNQVELNSVFMECEEGNKHAPPWVFANARDMQLQPLAAGEVGLLSYLDPTATSFPCFIIGDDIGRVINARCPCGRAGQQVEFHRRLARPINEGCALKMARDITR